MADETDTDIENNKINWTPVTIVGFIIVGLWLWTLFSFLLGDKFPLIPIGQRGTFGDMFGGLNALFSGAAFTGIIFTILLQRKELELQRKELRLTHEALEAQREEMQVQNETLKVQQFENTFFSMITVLNEIVNSMEIRKSNASKALICSGRDSMKFFHEELLEYLKGNRGLYAPKKKGDLSSHYYDWWVTRRGKLGHYFRIVYNIIQFINKGQSEKTIKQGRKYSRILRAQLSDQEQAIIFYNCLSDIGKGFMEDVKRHKLVKHVPDDFLINASHKMEYYPSIF